jgi:hypothetical protein
MGVAGQILLREQQSISSTCCAVEIATQAVVARLAIDWAVAMAVATIMNAD